MRLGSGNDLQTPQVRRVSTLAWRVKSVGSDHEYWPPLETAVVATNDSSFHLRSKRGGKIIGYPIILQLQTG